MTIDDLIDSKLSDIRSSLYNLYLHSGRTSINIEIAKLIDRVEDLQDFVIENSEE